MNQTEIDEIIMYGIASKCFEIKEEVQHSTPSDVATDDLTEYMGSHEFIWVHACCDP